MEVEWGEVAEVFAAESLLLSGLLLVWLLLLVGFGIEGCIPLDPHHLIILHDNLLFNLLSPGLEIHLSTEIPIQSLWRPKLLTGRPNPVLNLRLTGHLLLRGSNVGIYEGGLLWSSDSRWARVLERLRLLARDGLGMVEGYWGWGSEV